MKVVVTGAGGYIGRRVVRTLCLQGHEVVAASRAPLAALAWMPFDLRSAEVSALPVGTQAVVHLAAETGTHAADADRQYEVDSCTALLQRAAECGARFVFISSQTARRDAPTTYGRSKWRIEQEVLAKGGAVIRPGQVCGGAEQGLFGHLVGLVRALPVLPGFLPVPKVQPVHVDDLAEAICRVVARDDLGGCVLHVGTDPVPFTEFLRAIACYRVRRPRVFVPVPAVLVRGVRRMLPGRVGAAERLASLFELPAMATRHDLERLGMALRPLPAAVDRGSPRRELVREGRALLAYVLGQPAAFGPVRRYVHAVELLRAGQALAIPPWASACPALLALLDSGGASGEMRWRLDAASGLAEMSPQGAAVFLRPAARSSWVGTGWALALALSAEVGWRFARLLVSPWLRRGGT